MTESVQLGRKLYMVSVVLISPSSLSRLIVQRRKLVTAEMKVGLMTEARKLTFWLW